MHSVWGMSSGVFQVLELSKLYTVTPKEAVENGLRFIGSWPAHFVKLDHSHLLNKALVAVARNLQKVFKGVNVLALPFWQVLGRRAATEHHVRFDVGVVGQLVSYFFFENGRQTITLVSLAVIGAFAPVLLSTRGGDDPVAIVVCQLAVPFLEFDHEHAVMRHDNQVELHRTLLISDQYRCVTEPAFAQMLLHLIQSACLALVQPIAPNDDLHNSFPTADLRLM